MSDLLTRVKAVRQLMPGVKLQEAKQIVEAGADEALVRHLENAELALRQRVDADRRERIATALLASMCVREGGPDHRHRQAWAVEACLLADALMAELDARRYEEAEALR